MAASANENYMDRSDELPPWASIDNDLRKEVGSAMNQYKWLKERLQGLRLTVEGADRLTGVQSALMNAQEAADEIDKALSICKEQARNAFMPTATSTAKAEDVFSIPELVDEIFSQLSARDLLLAARVNRMTAAVVKDSPRLQETLCLRASKDGLFQTPLAGWNLSDSFACEMRYFGNTWGTNKPVNSVDFTITVRGHTMPRMGSRCRQMLVCQPAVSEMAVELWCCGLHATFDGQPLKREPIAPLRVGQGGITMGQVYDAAAKLMIEHQLCPYADYRGLDERGYAKVEPTFRASVHLQPNDPVLMQLREEAAKTAKSNEPWESSDRADKFAWMDDLEGKRTYCLAKQRGESVRAARSDKSCADSRSFQGGRDSANACRVFSQQG